MNKEYKLLIKHSNIEEAFDEDSRIDGELLHHTISLIDRLDEKLWQDELRTYLNTTLTQRTHPLKRPIFFKKLYPILTNFFSNDLIKPFFFLKAGEAIVWREKEIVDSQGEWLRCDRVILRTNKLEVIDFKFHMKTDQHRKQLKCYIETFKKLFPDKDVEGYLIYIIPVEVIFMGVMRE